VTEEASAIRVEDIDSGRVQLIPYEEVRRRLMARLPDAGK
jgi:hypothetical protein